MNKNVWIALFISICLVLTFPLTAPAKAITLSLADQNSEVGLGSGSRRTTLGETGREGHKG